MSTISRILGGLLDSKRFYITLTGVATLIIAHRMGMPIEKEEIKEVVNNCFMLISAWVLSDGLRPANPKNSDGTTTET